MGEERRPLLRLLGHLRLRALRTVWPLTKINAVANSQKGPNGEVFAIATLCPESRLDRNTRVSAWSAVPVTRSSGDVCNGVNLNRMLMEGVYLL